MKRTLYIISVLIAVCAVIATSFGVALPIEALITKVAIFTVLAIAAFYFEVKLFKAIKQSANP